MSVDDLIDPPYFPALDKKYQALKNAPVVQLVIGIIFMLVGAYLTAMALSGESFFIYLGLVLFALGLLNALVSRLSKKRLAKVEAELSAAVSSYIAAERSKLMAIKAKMNDAEWENYKLQLQNQKLLVQLNKKQNVKTRTTTTTGFITEITE
jgi:uncharacterized membrane protein YiaA